MFSVSDSVFEVKLVWAGLRLSLGFVGNFRRADVGHCIHALF